MNGKALIKYMESYPLMESYQKFNFEMFQELEAKFGDKVEVTGEGTPETTGYLEVVMVVVAIMMMMSSAPRRWSAEHLCRYYVLQDDHDGDQVSDNGSAFDGGDDLSMMARQS